MKKYPDRKNDLVGRVIIRQGETLWHLVSVDNEGVFHWMSVDEKSDGERTYYVGRVPHESKTSSGLLNGEHVFYPKTNARW
ncbi:MAG TPA: hypothetical protein V6C89_20645 [Drouetiella sp.]|jgi:hypothetical protein